MASEALKGLADCIEQVSDDQSATKELAHRDNTK